MKMTRTAVLAVSLAAACAPSSRRALAPEGLSYGVPEVNPAIYEFADTARLAIETGPLGTTRVTAAVSGVAELLFRRGEEVLHVVAAFPELSGVFENPAQGTARADESDMRGAAALEVDARGRVLVVDTPWTSAALEEITGVESLVRPLFAHLPAREVEPGASWIDTVVTREANGGTESVTRAVVTSTVAGDTALDGRRALRITTSSSVTVRVEGSSGGVEILQELEGVLTGHVLWDRRALTLVERQEGGQLRGTLALPAFAQTRLPVEARVWRRVRLRE